MLWQDICPSVKAAFPVHEIKLNCIICFKKISNANPKAEMNR